MDTGATKMIMYAKMEHFNIEYDEFQQEYYITSKKDGRPQIGSFKTARDAIEFADKRVNFEEKQNEQAVNADFVYSI